jgi:hypothetical protein
VRKPDPVERQLGELRAVPPGAADEVAVVRAGLRGKHGVVVAAAAKLVGDRRLDALAGELVPAFQRLCGDGAAKRDPGCRGKLAIAAALVALDRWEPDVFVAGLRIVQIEGFSREDTAAALRGRCGLAHAHLLRPDAVDVLADLLHDAWREARIAAAHGLGDLGRRDIAALLRFKLRLGDAEPDVLARCADSLLSIAGDDARPFLVDLLAGHDDRAEVIALALAGTRDAAVVAPLIAWADRAPAEVRRRVGYVAIALTRDAAAIAHLAAIVADGAAADAIAAARALATFRDVPDIAAKLRDAAARRPEIAAALGEVL